ncbi:MAG: tetratricopeptide repeat protein [Armatimonas sp.]
MVDIDTLWDYSDPAGTETRFVALLAEIQTQLARTHSLRKQFEQAHELLDTVEEALSAGPSRTHLRLWLERGRTYRSAGEPQKALPFFLRAWDEGRELGEDFLAIDAAHMLGIVTQGDESVCWNEEAIAVAARSTESKARRWLASLYNNLGWTYHDSEQYEKALEYFKKALDARREQAQPKEERIALWCVGRCLRSMGRVKEALGIQRGLSGWDNDGYVVEELGECLLALDQLEAARPYFAQAAKLLESDSSITAERLARLKELGQE